MDKAVEFFRDQMRGIRGGEISSGLIDTIRVEAYEQRLPLKQLAWTIPDKNRILVTPYDASLLGAIDKAIKSEGFNSYVFSKTQVVVNCPPVCVQDKDRVIAQINKLAEEARVVVRNIRKKTRQKAEDNIDKPLQQLTDEKIKEINDLAEYKASVL
jgi:ribosome recycling factor